MPGPHKKDAFPMYGSEGTFNMNSMLLENIRSSDYFKSLSVVRQWDELVDQIYYDVKPEYGCARLTAPRFRTARDPCVRFFPHEHAAVSMRCYCPSRPACRGAARERAAWRALLLCHSLPRPRPSPAGRPPPAALRAAPRRLRVGTPWLRGTHKQQRTGGMCSGLRGVANAGKPTTAFILVLKALTMRPTKAQIKGLLKHPDSAFIRATGFYILRYVCEPRELLDWCAPPPPNPPAPPPSRRGGACPRRPALAPLIRVRALAYASFHRAQVPAVPGGRGGAAARRWPAAAAAHHDWPVGAPAAAHA